MSPPAAGKPRERGSNRDYGHRPGAKVGVAETGPWPYNDALPRKVCESGVRFPGRCLVGATL